MRPSLPPELAPAILSQAPDAPTLKNLILSGPSFYHGFFATPKQIIKSVLLNEFGPELLPEALATYNSLRLPRIEFDSVREDLLLAIRNTWEMPDNWTLSDSLALSKILSDVEYFTSEFSIAWSHPPKGTITTDEEPITQTEKQRVRRAFFRFQFYCNLFQRHEGRPGPDARKQIFFDQFAPWELEQLATIYDYLLERLSIAFDDVADHDVLWGIHRIRITEDDTPPFNNYKEYCLSLGLRWLRKVASASTYEERYSLLAPETGNQEPDFLFKTFYYPYDLDQDMIELSDLTQETVLDHVQSPFLEDPDTGPFRAWWWAYQDSTAAYVYAKHELTSLRQSGYVMFDFDRLQRRCSLQSAFEPVNRHQKEKEQSLRNIEKMEQSYCKRLEIYNSGRRGYWSEDDNSKLIGGFSKPNEEQELELAINGGSHMDLWHDGILVDRVRSDDYILRDH